MGCCWIRRRHCIARAQIDTQHKLHTILEAPIITTSSYVPFSHTHIPIALASPRLASLASYTSYLFPSPFSSTLETDVVRLRDTHTPFSPLRPFHSLRFPLRPSVHDDREPTTENREPTTENREPRWPLRHIRPRPSRLPCRGRSPRLHRPRRWSCRGRSRASSQRSRR